MAQNLIRTVETDFTVPISPALEQALDDLSAKHLDALSNQDIQVIASYAQGMKKDKAYKEGYPEPIVASGHNNAPISDFYKRPEVVSAIRAIKRAHLLYTGVSYEQKMNFLWNMAKFCTTTMMDAEGNEIMKNPNAAKAAIAEMNKMSGDIAPEKKEVVIKQAELSEAELMDKIAGLTQVLELELAPIEVIPDEVTPDSKK